MQKKCTGFPDKPGGVCKNDATAIVLRVAVCEEHAKKAEAEGHRVQREKKEP